MSSNRITWTPHWMAIMILRADNFSTEKLPDSVSVPVRSQGCQARLPSALGCRLVALTWWLPALPGKKQRHASCMASVRHKHPHIAHKCGSACTGSLQAHAKTGHTALSAHGPLLYSAVRHGHTPASTTGTHRIDPPRHTQLEAHTHAYTPTPTHKHTIVNILRSTMGSSPSPETLPPLTTQ